MGTQFRPPWVLHCNREMKCVVGWWQGRCRSMTWEVQSVCLALCRGTEHALNISRAPGRRAVWVWPETRTVDSTLTQDHDYHDVTALNAGSRNTMYFYPLTSPYSKHFMNTRFLCLCTLDKGYWLCAEFKRHQSREARLEQSKAGSSIPFFETGTDVGENPCVPGKR